MKLYKHRANYWSNSKIARQILKYYGYDMPHAATGEEWEAWENKLSTEIPFVYWVVDDLSNKIQDFIMYPMDVYNHIRNYIVNRYVSKTHAVITTLSRGDWHESSELLLHSIFQILVDFVEIEKSALWYWNNTEKRPWYKRGIFKWQRFREPEKGLEYLKWETTLTEDSPNQAKAANEILALYDWWINVRPNRKDPWVESGLQEYYSGDEDKGSIWNILNKRTSDEDAIKFKQMHEIQDHLEQLYQDEDSEMMIKVINLRNEMWT